MNIVYLISFAGKAGTERYVENLMRLCTGAGDTCTLVYSVPGKLSETAEEKYDAVRLDLRPRRVLSAARELAALCRERQIDVVHAQYPRENVIALLSRLFRRETRVVFTSHLTIRQGRIWRYVNRIMTPHNAAVISVCQQGVKLLAENGVAPEKITVIPNGIEPRPMPPREDRIRQELRLPEDTFVFLTMARYAPEKGLEELLEAMAYIREQEKRRAVCAICGDGEDFERICALIREKKLEDTVFPLGYRTDGDALLSSADAYVSSARSNEAMSFAILEAMEHGLPVIVTDVGAGEELSRNCGFVSPPGDGEALGENMCRLLRDPELCRKMGQCAREKIGREYDLRQQAETVRKLYRSCL